MPFASEALNCAAPDTGNMEILNLYASEAVKERWLAPLLQGDIRSAFSMTEPEVASSDASNIELRIDRDGDHYVLNGKKWFSSNALRPETEVLIVMGKNDPDAPRHRQQSMIVVPKDTPGITIGRDPLVFGYHDRGGHPEVIYENVRVPEDHILGGEGEGFAISQARLGPGRIHHCMRSIGVAERALELMVKRSLQRETFGRLVAQHGLVQDWIAESRIEIDQARQYVLHVAHLMDTVGNKAAAQEISGHQGRRAQHGLEGHRPGHPGPRRRRRHPVHPAGPHVRPHADAADRRRPGRGPQDDHRPPRDQAARSPEFRMS